MGAFDIASLVALVIAATMLAVDQTLKSTPNLQNRAPFLELNGWFRWLPFLALVLAGLLLGIGSLTRATDEVSVASPQAVAPPQVMATRQALEAGLQRELILDDKIDHSQKYRSEWSVIGIDFDSVFSSIENRTSIEKEVLLKPHIGRSVLISGIVYDVEKADEVNHGIEIHLAHANYGPYAWLSFKSGKSDEVLRLKRTGDKISAKCKIKGLLGGKGLDLNDCEIH